MIEFQHELGILLKIIIASFLAGTVGFEREMEHKPAGLRTHMIMGGSATLIISLGEILIHDMMKTEISSAIHTDPIRLIQGMIIGLSFIGGGTILKLQNDQRVKYLATAASLFFSTGIGIGIALNQYTICIGVAIFILLINHFIGKIERYIYTKQKGTKNN
jgi:putative Mg2+ transporter-C (MgtC) family protein